MPRSRRPFPPRRRGSAVALAFVCALAAARGAAASRVLAVGDVHADVDAFRAVLRAAEVVDDTGRWRAGDATLVQLGDLLDRGPAPRATLDFARELEAQAAAAGGRYVQLLGNHEVMNLTGDLRYMAAEPLASFASARSETLRQDAWSAYRDWHRRRATRLGERAPSLGGAARREWLAAHPPGWLEHRELFAADGVYGRWLRERPAAAIVDRTLFVHGGIAPGAAGTPLDAIVARVRDEILRLDELRRELARVDVALPFFDLPETIRACRDEIAALARRGGPAAAAPEAATRRALCEELEQWSTWSIHSADGPLWFRGYDRWSDEELAAHLPALRAAYDVDRVVVGHTPQAGGAVRARGDGGVFLIDTGMLASYVEGGRGSALEIADGAVVTAIYAGAPRQVLWRAAEASVDAPAAATSKPPPATPEASAPPATPDATRSADGRPFVAPGGALLPFAGDDELLAFLAEAPIVDDEPIGEGITRPRRLTLERDGLRVRATFRTVEQEKRVAQLGARRESNFRDYHGFEPAAYRIGRLLGLTAIPPSTARRVGRESGSVQLWIEKATTEGRRLAAGTKPPSSVRWLRQLQTMMLWDDLVGNTDRNQGNILFDGDWRLWLIDHTRAFRTSTDLLQIDKINWIEQRFYERLRTVSDDAIREAARDFLRPAEIRALLERRQKLVRRLEALVGERGESAVLFSWDD